MKKIYSILTIYLTTIIANATIFYVVPNGAGNKDGTSWANAYGDIQTAIDAAASVATANAPAEVWIAGGTYYIATELSMKNNVGIYGGFKGNETSKNSRIFLENRTKIDGQGRIRIFYNNGVDKSAILDNVTLQNGYIVSVQTQIQICCDAYGAAIFNLNSSPQITNCVFMQNKVYAMIEKAPNINGLWCYARGSAVYNSSASSPTFNGCIFFENSAEAEIRDFAISAAFNPNAVEVLAEDTKLSAEGGAIYNTENSSCTVDKCSFERNYCAAYVQRYGDKTKVNARGGAIYGKAFISNSSFLGNISLGRQSLLWKALERIKAALHVHGAAVYLTNGTITNSSIFGNQVESSIEYNDIIIDSSLGGNGVSCYDSKIINCSFYGNKSYDNEELCSRYDIAGSGNKLLNNIINANKEGNTYVDLVDFEGYITMSSYKVLVPKKQTIALGAGIIDEDTPMYDACGHKRPSDRCTAGAYEWINANNQISLAFLNSQSNVLRSIDEFDLKVFSDAYLPTYQWQESSDGGNTWKNISSNSDTLHFSNISQAKDRSQYRCIVTDNKGNKLTSNSFTLIFNPTTIAITTQPKEKLNLSANTSTTFSLTAQSPETLSYQWEMSLDNGNTWTSIDGANSNSFSRKFTYSEDNALIRCKISDSIGTIYSDSVKVTLYRTLTITQQPKDVISFTGYTALLSVGVSYVGEISYQWQEYVNGKWVDIKGANDAEYYPPEMSDVVNGRQYRVVIKNGNLEEISNIVTYKRSEKDIIISKQPYLNTPIYEGNAYTLSVGATNIESYQWCEVVVENDVISLRPIDNATSSNYQLNITRDMAGKCYVCVIGNSDGYIISNLVFIFEGDIIYSDITSNISAIETSEDITFDFSKNTQKDCVYILCKNGKEIARTKNSNITITEKEKGVHNYTVYADFGENCVSKSIGFVSITVNHSPKDSGKIWYVKPTGDDSADGKSWDTAFASVKKAVDEAGSQATSDARAEVWVAQGIYSISSPIKMMNDVSIIGGFIEGDDDINDAKKSNITHLSGNNKNRLIENNYSKENTLTNSARVKNIIFSKGKNANKGGAVYNYYASPIFQNCEFNDNSVYEDKDNGYAGDLDLYKYGGAVYNNYSNAIYENCSFSNNTIDVIGKSKTGVYASSRGGAVSDSSSNVKYRNCTFAGNKINAYAENTDGYYSLTINAIAFGGAYYGSFAEFENCTFYNNKTTSDAYIVSSRGGTAKAEAQGGAVYSNTSKFIHCTFAKNTAEEGGAIYTTISTNENYVSLQNCILWGNVATSTKINGLNYINGGDAIYVGTFYPIPTSYYGPQIDTCIIGGNVRGSEYCSITGKIEKDPILKELSDNGGAVQTIAVDAESSAIGVGKPIENIKTDARGILRSTTPTIGAYEYLYGKPTYEKWMLSQQLPQETSEPTLILHNDNITNIEKFTFGLDVKKSSSYSENPNFKLYIAEPLRTFSLLRTANVSTTQKAVFEYPISVDAKDIKVVVYKSVDLETWDVADNVISVGLSADNKFMIYRVEETIPVENKIFFKIEVQE